MFRAFQLHLFINNSLNNRARRGQRLFAFCTANNPIGALRRFVSAGGVIKEQDQQKSHFDV
jgi:hypothetical protein